MFDAGMNSLSAFREYSVSPWVGSTMRIPQYPLRNSRVVVIESTNAAKAARGSVDAATEARVGGRGDAERGAACAPAQPARIRATDDRRARMRDESVRRALAADVREA
jgi:hypothetical protein